MSNRQIFLKSMLALLVILMMTACEAQDAPSAQPTDELPASQDQDESTPLPAAPTQLPPDGPGSQANPIQFIFVSADPDEVEDLADNLADTFSEDSDLAFEVRVTEDPAEALTALCSGEAAFISLGTFGTISAVDRDCGTVMYRAEIDDQVTRLAHIVSLRPRILSVQNIRTRIVCRPDAFSVYGWIVPSLVLQANGINPATDLADFVDTEDDQDTLDKILNRECDVGTVIVDAEQELDNPNQILIIEQLPPIPNDSLLIASRLDEDLEALVRDLVSDSEDELAEMVGADRLVEPDPADFVELRDLLQAAGVDVAALAR